MSVKKINTRTLVLVLFILVIGLFRSLSEDLGVLANFTPVGAMALFAGVYFKDKWKAYMVPLGILLISDMTFNYLSFGTLFYPGMVYVYIAFALMVTLGGFINRVSATRVILGSLGVVLIHWIVTDIGVWLSGTIFPVTPAGLMQCLIAAIPFEKSFLIGTLLYSAVMFGGYELLGYRFPRLKLQQQSAV